MPGAKPAKCPNEWAIDSYVFVGSSPIEIVVKPSKKPCCNLIAAFFILKSSSLGLNSKS